MIPTLRRHLSFILLHLQPRFTFIFPLVTPDPLLLSFIQALCSFLVKGCHYFPLTAENRPNLLPLTLLLPCQSHEQQSLLGFDLQSSQQLQPLLTASSSHHITSAFFCIPALTDWLHSDDITGGKEPLTSHWEDHFCLIDLIHPKLHHRQLNDCICEQTYFRKTNLWYMML